MTFTKLRRTLALFVAVNTSGCGLLDVSNPTAIEDEQLSNAIGADLLRGTALSGFYNRWGRDALETGEYTDELTSYVSLVRPPSSTAADRRDVTFWTPYADWQEQRRNATVAFAKPVDYGARAHAGEMLALRGYATHRLAATFCPGFPINELDGFGVVLGGPVTTEQAYERALADFEAALTLAADSARVLNLARIGRGNALLGLGRFEQAAAAVADVPTGYAWVARFDAASSANPLALSTFPSNDCSDGCEQVPTIADREGRNGLDFASADDPRIEPRQYGSATPPVGAGEPVYEPGKYAADGGSSIVVASGIEARLIEAEAALAEEGATWLSILNDLRATQISPALGPLEDPGTPATRLDLLFRERAFWLFATGHRLPDLLRLVRLYGRDPDSVFPTGEYHQHGYFYGTSTSLRFDPTAETGNSAVTGCTGI